MAKKIEIIGAKPKKIHIVNPQKPRLDPAAVAEGLGAKPCGERIEGNLDPIGLAELGTQLLARLRSSGGRPALADATEICRVPLSAEDLKLLETITEQIAEASGTKPSPGQVASVIVREYLSGPGTISTGGLSPSKASWPEGWNGNRQKYKAAQQLIQNARSTWGRNGAA